MLNLSIANQAFGYLTTIVLSLGIVIFFKLVLSGEPEKILAAILLFVLYAGIPAITLSMVWIILSIVQCCKFKKFKTIGKITPRIGITVLSIFTSIALALILMI